MMSNLSAPDHAEQPPARAPESDPDLDRFDAQGYLGPIDLLDQPTCRRLTRLLKLDQTTPADWPKGCAVSSRLHYEIACLPRLTSLVSKLLGGPVMLWGSSLILRLPAQHHAWHSDIETAGTDDRTVSVWIGLEGTNRGSGLSLIAGSHRFGQPLQKLASQHGVGKGELDSDTVMSWATQFAADAGTAQPDIHDGQAIIFDGRLWHGSANGNALLPRRALLLQYASPDTPIRSPDPNSIDWPLQRIQHPRPPSVMVVGSGTSTMNKLVSPPPIANSIAAAQLSTVIQHLPNPMPEDTDKGWRPHFVLSGQTTQVLAQGCHASVLSAQTTPHPPHQHDEEEILLMLSGQAELQIVDDHTGKTTQQTLRERELVYYPRRGVRHTLSNTGSEPAVYLMFKWRGFGAVKSPDLLRCQVFRLADAFARLDERNAGFATELIVEGQTEYLRTLHAHVSTVQPGAGYAEHVDAHDVAIVLLEGEVETLGQRAGPTSVIYYAGGQAHGLQACGDVPARYLVIEFHGQRNSALMPMRFDAVNLKAALKHGIRQLTMRSSLLEGMVRKAARLLRRR